MIEAWNKLGEKPDALVELGEPPYELAYLFDWFKSARQFGISYTELKAWADLSAIDIRPWEVKVIIDLDRMVSNA